MMILEMPHIWGRRQDIISYFAEDHYFKCEDDQEIKNSSCRENEVDAWCPKNESERIMTDINNAWIKEHGSKKKWDSEYTNPDFFMNQEVNILSEESKNCPRSQIDIELERNESNTKSE